MTLTDRDYKIITHITSPQDNNQENTYYYQADAAGSAFALGNDFISDVVPNIMDVVSSAGTMYLVEVINMVDLDDFAYFDIDVDGTRGAAAMPAFNVYAFTYVPLSRAVHSGKKSIGPIAEADVSNGAIVAGMAGPIATLVAGLEETLVTGLVSYAPGIMKTEKQVCAECKSGFRYVPKTWFPVGQVIYKKVSHLTSRPSV